MEGNKMKQIIWRVELIDRLPQSHLLRSEIQNPRSESRQSFDQEEGARRGAWLASTMGYISRLFCSNFITLKYFKTKIQNRFADRKSMHKRNSRASKTM